MIRTFPLQYRDYSVDTPLTRLFDMALTSQLLPADGSKAYTFGVGSSIRLPSASLLITHCEAHRSIDGFTYAEVAYMNSEDVLAISLDDVSEMVRCELHLFAPSWSPSFSVPRLALWVSSHGLAALVPVKPRNLVDRLPPSFALTRTGVRVLADPFVDDHEWATGVRRAVDAISRLSMARPVKSTPVLRLVR